MAWPTREPGDPENASPKWMLVSAYPQGMPHEKELDKNEAEPWAVLAREWAQEEGLPAGLVVAMATAKGLPHYRRAYNPDDLAAACREIKRGLITKKKAMSILGVHSDRTIATMRNEALDRPYMVFGGAPYYDAQAIREIRKSIVSRYFREHKEARAIASRGARHALATAHGGMTAPEAARALGVKESTLIGWIKAGKIHPSHRNGRYYEFMTSDIEPFIKKEAVARIYIAGPITGHANSNRMAFEKAKLDIEASGRAVVTTPFDVYQARGPALDCPALEWCEAMPKCLDMVANCDYVYLLDGWEKSKGARKEFEEAKKLGKKILYEKEGSPDFDKGKTKCRS